MVACPVCRRRTRTPLCGRVVFAQTECPVCFEEVAWVVSFPCGHLVCRRDFERLGGLVEEVEVDDSLHDENRPREDDNDGDDDEEEEEEEESAAESTAGKDKDEENEEEISLSRWFGDSFTSMWGEAACLVGSDLEGFEAALDRNPAIADLEEGPGFTALHCCLASVSPPPMYALIKKLVDLNPSAVGKEMGVVTQCPNSIVLFLDNFHATYGSDLSREESNYDPADVTRIVRLLPDTSPDMCLKYEQYGEEDSFYDTAYGFAYTPQEISVMARACPESLKFALLKIGMLRFWDRGQSRREQKALALLEVLRLTFQYKREFLTTETEFWRWDPEDEPDSYPEFFEEEGDEDGETLLEHLLQECRGGTIYGFVRQVVDLLIQCMHSAFHEVPEVTSNDPLDCLKSLVHDELVTKDVLRNYKNLAKRTPTHTR